MDEIGLKCYVLCIECLLGFYIAAALILRLSMIKEKHVLNRSMEITILIKFVHEQTDDGMIKHIAIVHWV